MFGYKIVSFGLTSGRQVKLQLGLDAMFIYLYVFVVDMLCVMQIKEHFCKIM